MILPVCRRFIWIMEQFPPFPVARGRVLLWMPDHGAVVRRRMGGAALGGRFLYG